MDKQIGNFIFKKTPIKGVYEIEVKKYGDNRGYFMETYKEVDFKNAGLDYKFVQDNQSKSKKGVLRGLHFQRDYPQAKLVRCIEGEVFDACVDLRKDSPTYLQYESFELSEENNLAVLVPAGIGHAFISLEDNTIQVYTIDRSGNDGHSKQINYADEKIGLKLPVPISEISDYDRNAPFIE